MDLLSAIAAFNHSTTTALTSVRAYADQKGSVQLVLVDLRRVMAATIDLIEAVLR